MKSANISKFIPTASVKNAGITREWTVCSYVGITRVTHDHTSYDKDSDVNVGDRHISIKASKFTLMSGNLCEGLSDFDSIWALYAHKCHSNEWCYVTEDFTAYFMDKDEFKTFVYTFCHIEKESEKNGGAYKIRCKAESKKMLQWFNERA